MRAYQQTFQTMLAANQAVFDEFKEIHDKFASSPQEWKEQFNQSGSRIVDIIRDYERRLCSQMGKGQYGKFSHNLSEKFWNEVRKVFPKIDFVGIK